MHISEAESVVMQALWTQGPMTADQVIAEVAAGQGWQEPTVKTLLNRLLTKGAISATREGRRYVYAAELSHEDWLGTESQSLLDRLFGGRVAPLVAHFSDRRKLSKKDLAELKKLVRELDDES